MVLKAGQPYAVFFASCYDHGGAETWIDVIFGTWGQTPTAPDHITFGCRFGAVENSKRPAASAVNAAQGSPESTMFGIKLSRDAALRHARLPEFWQVVDFVVANDPLVHAHHTGHAPSLPFRG